LTVYTRNTIELAFNVTAYVLQLKNMLDPIVPNAYWAGSAQADADNFAMVSGWIVALSLKDQGTSVP
jgi:hypothetical protein